MAEVEKIKEKKKLIKVSDEKTVKKGSDKVNKKNVNSKEKNSEAEKKGLWYRFMAFCHGVKSEFKRVRWTSKEDMIKYSVATIVFIIFCSLFFYTVDVIFALIQSLFK